MRRARNRGFTLVELVLAMALLAVMMLLLYSGLSFALRSWDAGEAGGRQTADRRIGENFLRRELTELFPMRWKDPMTLKFAFEGDARRLRFVSSRPAGISQGGLSLVGLAVEPTAPGRPGDLVMRRAMPDDDAKDFRPLDAAEAKVLIAGVDEVKFEYFGAENDFTQPQWTDKWGYEARIPEMIRVRIKTADARPIPEMIVKIHLGEEAGCLENVFQRVCRPRRPA
jgi:general secretion pathway protein J